MYDDHKSPIYEYNVVVDKKMKIIDSKYEHLGKMKKNMIGPTFDRVIGPTMEVPQSMSYNQLFVGFLLKICQ